VGVDSAAPTSEVSPRRRDIRTHPASTGLPAAQPVQSARASLPAHRRRRAIAPWLITGVAALAVACLIVVGAVSLTGHETSVLADSDGETRSGRDGMSTSCTAAPSERGGGNHRCDTALDREELVQNAPSTPRVETIEDERDAPDGDPADPDAPDDTTPSAPWPQPPATSPGNTEQPADPSSSAPPAPPASAPAPPASAPQPLAFADIEENHVIGLLDIKILSSYSLSLSGQPGSTASVDYGSTRVGSVTFGDDGRASITLGGSLISAGLRNPTIRVAYADGTTGSAIQAPRDSI